MKFLPSGFKLSDLFKESVIYGLAGYVWIITATFLTPVYTRILTKADYGYMDIFNTWIAFLVLLIPLGLVQSITRFWMDVKGDRKAIRNLVGSIQSAVLFAFVGFLGLSFVGKTYFEAEILKSAEHSYIYWLSLLIIFGQIELAIQLELLKVRFQKWSFATVSLVNFVLLSSLGFATVYFMGWGIKGFYIASVVGLYAALLVSFFFNRRYLSLAFDFKLVISYLRYSIFFLFVLLFFGLSNIIDRYILNQYLGIEEAGIYNIATKIAAILLLIGNSFSAAWLPRALDKVGDPDEQVFFSKVHDKFLLLTSLVFILVVLFRVELIAFFAPTYADSYNAILLLAAFNLVNAIGPIYATGIHISKRSVFLLIAATVSIGINVGLSLLLVQSYGINGIAIGTLVGGLFWTGLRLYFSRRLYRIEFNFRTYFMVVPAVVLGVCAAYSVDLLGLGFWRLVPLKVLIGAGFVFCYWKYFKGSSMEPSTNPKTKLSY